MNSNDDLFAAWFAGLLDGEGCFGLYIHDYDDGRVSVLFRCQVDLRADDRPLLEALRARLGVGRVVDRPARKTGNPQAVWMVSGRACNQLRPWLARAPLQSKKARDVDIWLAALDIYNNFKRGGATARAHNEPLLSKIRNLRIELTEVRRYANP